MSEYSKLTEFEDNDLPCVSDIQCAIDILKISRLSPIDQNRSKISFIKNHDIESLASGCDNLDQCLIHAIKECRK